MMNTTKDSFYERGYAEWCRWVADRLEEGFPGVQ
jgi:hypothetical protein